MLNVQELHELIKLIDQSTLDEFNYETEEQTITMKKGSSQKESERINPAEVIQSSDKDLSTISNNQQSYEENINDTSDNDQTQNIVAPMVGTFYAKPDPNSDSYVKKGTSVSEDTVVCMIEAMKLFNEIEAEVTGEITEVLVNDGELVEYGQPLFKVKTN